MFFFQCERNERWPDPTTLNCRYRWLRLDVPGRKSGCKSWSDQWVITAIYKPFLSRCNNPFTNLLVTSWDNLVHVPLDIWPIKHSCSHHHVQPPGWVIVSTSKSQTMRRLSFRKAKKPAGWTKYTLEVNHHFKHGRSFWIMINPY